MCDLCVQKLNISYHTHHILTEGMLGNHRMLNVGALFTLLCSLNMGVWGKHRCVKDRLAGSIWCGFTFAPQKAKRQAQTAKLRPPSSPRAKTVVPMSGLTHQRFTLGRH